MPIVLLYPKIMQYIEFDNATNMAINATITIVA